MKKLRNMLFWLGVTVYLVVALGFISGKINEIICEDIKITVLDTLENRFISGQEILEIMIAENENLLGYRLNGINTLNLEKSIGKVPFIKDVRIYKTLNNQLNADIIQRNPVIRVFNNSGSSYYIDMEGYIMPLSDKYTSRVLVANGAVNEPFIVQNNQYLNISQKPDDKRDAIIYDLYRLAIFIHKSDLWKAQIAQIYVTENYEFELIPRVGAHIILFGNAADIETKFKKLEALYRYGLNNKGWNNYETINLKYENQVVCTKR